MHASHFSVRLGEQRLQLIQLLKRYPSESSKQILKELFVNDC